MNDEAVRLGLSDTHYANPDGLDNPEQYSSAVDLAKLGDVVMQNPVIRSIVAMRAASIPNPAGSGAPVILGNINPLLGAVAGVNGVKTGYTSEALNLAVESEVRGGQGVIAVVTGEPAPDLVPDAINVLNYGFSLAGNAPPALPKVTVAPTADPTSRPVPYSSLAEEQHVLGTIALPPGFALAVPGDPIQARTEPAYRTAVVSPAVPTTRGRTVAPKAGLPWWVLGAGVLVLTTGVRARVVARRRRRTWRTYGPTPWQVLERTRQSASGQ